MIKTKLRIAKPWSKLKPEEIGEEITRKVLE